MRVSLLLLALLLLATAEAVDRRELLGAKKSNPKKKKTHQLSIKPPIDPNDATRAKFEEYKKKYGKAYASPEEEAARYAEFQKVEEMCVGALS